MLYIKETTRENVLRMLMSFYEMGCRVHHFNGSQWYVQLANDLVFICDTSRETDEPVFKIGSSAIDYLKSGSNMSYELDENGRQVEFKEQLNYFKNVVVI